MLDRFDIPQGFVHEGSTEAYTLGCTEMVGHRRYMQQAFSIVGLCKTAEWAAPI